MAITIHPVCVRCGGALTPDETRWEWHHTTPLDHAYPRLCRPGDSWESAQPVITAQGRTPAGAPA